MATKPENTVTRALKEIWGRDGERLDLPVLTASEIEALEALFPPLCYDHRTQNLEAHLVYSGKVELVADLKFAFQEFERTKVELLDGKQVEKP